MGLLRANGSQPKENQVFRVPFSLAPRLQSCGARDWRIQRVGVADVQQLSPEAAMRKIFLAATVAVALGWASPAAADLVSFDPDGPGPLGAVQGETFDWQPGNTLLIEEGSGDATILFQANLNTVTAPDGSVGPRSCSRRGPEATSSRSWPRSM